MMRYLVTIMMRYVVASLVAFSFVALVAVTSLFSGSATRSAERLSIPSSSTIAGNGQPNILIPAWPISFASSRH